MNLPICGNCLECRARTAAILSGGGTGSTWRRVTYGYGYPTVTRGEPVGPYRAPTLEEIHRHVKRHGSECVAEVAAKYGHVLPGTQRAIKGDVAARVLELRAEGYVPSAIADALSIGERRVRQLLRRRTAT